MGAVQMLEDAGFTVVEAVTPMTQCDPEDRKDVCAIFTDINMPGTMDGMSLPNGTRSLAPISPDCHSGLVFPNNDDLPPGGKFIHKPYDPRHVIATLRELLGQTSTSDPRLQARKAA